ncbi:MAG: tandem-95 repeat protein [Proteobacteria bacterium]|nr:tandem-95 repeat protein [Pseudomonadota bacterium]
MGDNTTASKPIGNVITLEGTVSAESPDGVRLLSTGSPLFQGDVLITDEGSRVELKFADDTQLSQGENSRISLDAYVYDANEGSNSGLLLNMVEGTFRCVTGKIVEQNPDNFILKSPLATLGIRGTTTVSEIHGSFEKHGAENISQGKTMVIQDSMGTVRFITKPLSIIDFTPGKPIGMPRTFTPIESNHFKLATPLSDADHLVSDTDRDNAHHDQTDSDDRETENQDNDSQNDHHAEDHGNAHGQTPFGEMQANESVKNILSGSMLATTPKELIPMVKPIVAYLDVNEFHGKANHSSDIYLGPGTDDAHSDNVDHGTDTQPANIPPITKDIPFSVAEDEGLSGKVTASDPDGGHLTYTLKTSAANGNVTAFSPDGHFEYTPNPDFHGDDRFTFEVSDGQGGTSTGKVNITVNPVNDDPSATEESYLTISEDSPLSGKATATDIDNSTTSLDYSKVSDPSHGTVHVNPDGSFTYIPDPNYNGSDSFRFMVQDESGGHSEGTINITVTPVNDAPDAHESSVTVNEETPYSGVLSVNDPDGEVLSYAITQDPQNGTVSGVSSDGSFTYTPDTGFHGADHFTYTVTDTQGLSDTATVSITVSNVNDPPAAENAVFTLNEDASLTSLLPATDPEGDALTFSKKTDPSHGTVVVQPDGVFVYTPDENYNGADRFTYDVQDESGGTATATVDITVAPVNDLPETADFSFSTSESYPKTGVLTGTDVDEGDTLTFSKTFGPSHGSLSVSGNGVYTYTPTTGYTGSDTFTYTVDDGHGGKDTATASITITAAPNSAPVANDMTISASMGTSVNETVSGSDPDLDPLTFSKTTNPSHGTVPTFTASTGEFTYQPDTNYWGEDLFNFSVADSYSATDTGTVFIHVGSTDGNDVITGTSSADIIYGLDGNDTIDPGIGNDFIHGGAGNDHINILSDFTFEDTVDGGAGTDTLGFMDGTATDELFHVTNIEEILLPSQATTVNIVTTDGLIAAGMTLSVDASALSYSGVLDWDGSAESDGKMSLIGGNLPDFLKGGAGDDTIQGSEGDDSIHGNDGNDFLDGQSEYDTIYGGNGHDSIEGGSHDDYLYGDAGNDTLLGEDGYDHLYGGTGTDILDGGPGNDTLAGDAGIDTLTGGSGNDIFTYADSLSFGDTITDFNATLGDGIKIDVDATGLFSDAVYGANVRLVNLAGSNGASYALSLQPSAKHLFSAANVTGFTASVKAINIGALQTCLAFGLVGTGTSRKLMAAIGQNTNADTIVENVVLHTVATLQGVSGVGPSANQIDYTDIIIH